MANGYIDGGLDWNTLDLTKRQATFDIEGVIHANTAVLHDRLRSLSVIQLRLTINGARIRTAPVFDRSATFSLTGQLTGEPAVLAEDNGRTTFSVSGATIAPDDGSADIEAIVTAAADKAAGALF